jgi:hypothetical protein
LALAFEDQLAEPLPAMTTAAPNGRLGVDFELVTAGLNQPTAEGK